MQHKHGQSYTHGNTGSSYTVKSTRRFLIVKQVKTPTMGGNARRLRPCCGSGQHRPGQDQTRVAVEDKGSS
uniref:Uncharacterized protein n=1 Tax=Arundo donax TaxID=35708 RepID=A0A0A8Z559_ARUDO